MKSRWKKRDGFTLVEVIVTLVILAILAAIMVPALVKWIDKAKEKKCIQYMGQIIRDYHACVAETGYGQLVAINSGALLQSSVTDVLGAGVSASAASYPCPVEGGATCSVVFETTTGGATAISNITCSKHGSLFDGGSSAGLFVFDDEIRKIVNTYTTNVVDMKHKGEYGLDSGGIAFAKNQILPLLKAKGIDTDNTGWLVYINTTKTPKTYEIYWSDNNILSSAAGTTFDCTKYTYNSETNTLTGTETGTIKTASKYDKKNDYTYNVFDQTTFKGNG